MRNRFFFIILATLTLAATAIHFVHIHFFKNQRLNLIDRQITESSDALFEFPEFLESIENPASIEEGISKALGGTRIGKVFILRDADARILYQSFNVSLLDAEIPLAPEWVAVETENEYIRVRNVRVPDHPSLVFQVGLVVDRNFLNWKILDRRVIVYVAAIVASLFLASVLLTLVLLAPLRMLIAHLKVATSDLANLRDVEPLPADLSRYTRGYWARSDEFSSLLNAVRKLIDRINLNYKLTRAWTLQMAHELKTPLAIIRAENEARREGFEKSVAQEIDKMSETISQFLEWAELESSQVQRDLHVLRIGTVARAVVTRLERIEPTRLQLKTHADFAIYANPIHLDQLITNLVTNALKFSPAQEPIEVEMSDHILTVRDRGPGVPAEVRERLGEPFNLGPRSERAGHGLGLAWVLTVTKLYGWEFELANVAGGTEARVRFPREEV